MINAGYTYFVENVKKRPAKDRTITSFTIKDTVYKGDKTHWWNCCVWKDVDLADGDKIKIDAITSLSATQYNEKIYLSYFMDITVVSKVMSTEVISTALDI